MCTISHLYMAFMVTIELCKNNIPEQVITPALKFIADFKMELHKNIESLADYIAVLQTMEELAHLKAKLPQVPVDLCLQIEQTKQSFCNKFKKQSGNKESESNFALNQLLNVDAQIGGHKLPLPFKTYQGYTTNCHEYYEVVII